MESIKKYFTIGTVEWKTTVKYSFRIGLILGLFIGLVIILKIL